MAPARRAAFDLCLFFLQNYNINTYFLGRFWDFLKIPSPHSAQVHEAYDTNFPPSNSLFSRQQRLQFNPLIPKATKYCVAMNKQYGSTLNELLLYLLGLNKASTKELLHKLRPCLTFLIPTRYKAAARWILFGSLTPGSRLICSEGGGRREHGENGTWEFTIC